MRALPRIADLLRYWWHQKRSRPRRLTFLSAVGDMVLESVELEPSGLLRLTGWSGKDEAALPRPVLRLDGVPAAFLQCYRTLRPDARRDAGSPLPAGIVFEYLADATAQPRAATIAVELEGARLFRGRGEFRFATPHYAHLFRHAEVAGREHIYGYGPPSADVGHEVDVLARLLTPPVLDFGCGGGALLRLLRARGVEAFGIELDRPPIRAALADDVRDQVTLYDGAMPLPFADGAFASCISSEVIEHVPDHAGALAEIARVTRERFIITVPDISAIPLCAPHNVVPWHLLESTHVNFFTQSSLDAALRPHFRHVEHARMSANTVNGSLYHTSLVAICDK